MFYCIVLRQLRLPLLLCTLSANTLAEEPASLTLVQALQRFSNANPQLQLSSWQLRALSYEQQQAALQPATNLELSATNVAGSGTYAGAAEAEYQLALSSLLELGDKQRARLQLAGNQYALAAANRDADALQLTAALTQQFISTLMLQEKAVVTQLSVQLADDALTRIRARLAQGAAATADLARAQAALIQAQLTQSALQAELHSQQQTLAAFWNQPQADFQTVRGDLLNFAAVSDFESLYERATRSPLVQVLAAQERLLQAQQQLLQSQSQADINWRIGISHFASGDNALSAGIAVPLFSGSRNRAALQASHAQLAGNALQQQQTLLELRSRLFRAYQQYQHNVSAARRIQSDMIPVLQQALDDTRQGYLRGRYRYSEWAGARSELLNARLALIDNAGNALLQQALIEQLTAQSLTE